jgi:hypothetical protein
MSGMSTQTASTIDAVLQQERIEKLRRVVSDLRSALADVDAAVAEHRSNVRLAHVFHLSRASLELGLWGLGTLPANWWVSDTYQIFKSYRNVLTEQSSGWKGVLDMAAAGGAKYALAAKLGAENGGATGVLVFKTAVDVVKLGTAIHAGSMDEMTQATYSLAKNVARLAADKTTANLVDGRAKSRAVVDAVHAWVSDTEPARVDAIAGATRAMIAQKIQLFGDRLALEESRRGLSCAPPAPF